MTRGRPPKTEAERFEYYVYVRLTEKQHEAVKRLAKSLGFAESGGMAPAVRWCVEKMTNLVESKNVK